MLIRLTAQFILEKFARSAQQYMREKIFFFYLLTCTIFSAFKLITFFCPQDHALSVR